MNLKLKKALKIPLRRIVTLILSTLVLIFLIWLDQGKVSYEKNIPAVQFEVDAEDAVCKILIPQGKALIVAPMAIFPKKDEKIESTLTLTAPIMVQGCEDVSLSLSSRIESADLRVLPAGEFVQLISNEQHFANAWHIASVQNENSIAIRLFNKIIVDRKNQNGGALKLGDWNLSMVELLIPINPLGKTWTWEQWMAVALILGLIIFGIIAFSIHEFFHSKKGSGCE